MTILKPNFEKGGSLVPAIVQDADTLRVLMLGYMNEEALAATESTGLVTFYSRSKQRLWQKGETSGHVLRVQSIALDCDQDALLILAKPEGPTCHTGAVSCFGDVEGGANACADLAVLAALEKTIAQRQESGAQGSYTASLFAEGPLRIAQKVGEEGVEVALAAAASPEKLAEESADLLYHLLVLLRVKGLRLADVLAVLRARAQK